MAFSPLVVRLHLQGVDPRRPGQLGRSPWRWGTTPAALALSAALLVSCDDAQKNAYVPPPPPPVTVAQPLQQPVTQYFNLTGNTAPVNSVDLVARVQGFLESIDYKDGAMVKKGDQLFGIQRDSYQAQLDQANATLAADVAAQSNAQSNYQRQLTLSKQNFAALSALEDAKTTLDQANSSVLGAKASLQIATINLGYTTVSAPFDGTVTNHLVDVGSLVGVSGPTTLATIVQTDPLYVYFNVSEPQVLLIREGLAKQGRQLRDIDIPNVPVEVGLQGEDGYPHKGHLDYVSPQVDSNTGTLQVRALFDNKDHALLPGLFARVRVPVQHLDKALLIPADAVGSGQLGSYVLVLGKDDEVEQRQVKLGQRQGQFQIVLGGLEAGDWIVTQGIQSAAPGSKVKPEKSVLSADVAQQPADTAAPKKP